LAREFEIGKIPLSLSPTLNASVKADLNVGFAIPAYVFATPVLGGQLSASMLGVYGVNDTRLAGTLTGQAHNPFR